MNDPIKEALQLQQKAKELGVDVFELINKDVTELPDDNPFLDEEGKPYHDTPEED
jgi:hypothetical protein